MRRLITVGILLSVVTLFALLTGFSLYFRLAYIIALALLGGLFWSWLNLRGLKVEVERRYTRSQVGGYLDGRIRVRNTILIPKAWVEVEEFTDMPGHASGQVVSLAGKQLRSWRVQTICRQRGVYYIGPVKVTSGDPFGFFRFHRLFSERKQVIVYPRAVPLPYFTLPPAFLPSEGATKHRTHQPTALASSVREYSYGDSVNRVHWPTTARMGTLMVKEFDIGLSGHVWILLDLQKEVQDGQGLDNTEELAVVVAASVGSELLRRKVPVGLVASGDRNYLLRPDSSPSHLQRFLEHLAMAKALGRISLDRSIYELEGLLGRYSTLLVITPSAGTEWIPPLVSIKQRGISTAVILIDSQSFGATRSLSFILDRLFLRGIPTFLIRKGQALDEALKAPINQGLGARVKEHS